MNQYAKYLGQKSFHSEAIVRGHTGTHTTDRLLYLDHCNADVIAFSERLLQTKYFYVAVYRTEVVYCSACCMSSRPGITEQ